LIFLDGFAKILQPTANSSISRTWEALAQLFFRKPGNFSAHLCSIPQRLSASGLGGKPWKAMALAPKSTSFSHHFPHEKLIKIGHLGWYIPIFRHIST
jgi:hypothetical protein